MFTKRADDAPAGANETTEIKTAPQKEAKPTPSAPQVPNSNAKAPAPQAQPIQPQSAPTKKMSEPSITPTPQPVPRPGSAAGAVNGKLIVGQEINLNGEIKKCDHLVVEGAVNADLKECRQLDVLVSGHFDGTADVETCEISGKFDGELTVKGKLVIRNTGVITGTTKYGEIEIERGGKVSGTVEVLGS